MEMSIQVDPRHLALIKKILREHLPQNAKIWVFGSRASGNAKKFSDLDLCIDILSEPLADSLKADLTEAFSESDIPYRIDIVDWNGITDAFRKQIDAHKIKLTL